MQQTIIKNLFSKKTIFVLALLILIITLFNLSVTVVYTDKPVDIFFGSSSLNPKFSKNSKKRHVVFSKKGRRVLLARSNENMSGAIVQTKPFMIPETIKLDINEQYVSSKISSNGSTCVIYDNPKNNISVASDCIGGGSQLFFLKNGVPSVSNNLGEYTYQSASTARDGLFIETEEQYEDFAKVYNVRFFNVRSDSLSDTLKTSSVPGLFVNDSKTGLAAGYINGLSFTKFKNNAVDYELKLDGDSKQYIVSTYSDGKLYVFSGNNPGNIETENGPIELVKQTITTYDGSKKINTLGLDSGYFLYNLDALDNNHLLANAADANGENIILIINKQTGGVDTITPINAERTVSSIFPIEKGFLYLNNGKIWMYDMIKKQHHSAYSSKKVYIKTAIRQNDKLLIGATYTEGLNHKLYMPNFILDLKNNLWSDKVRLESILPTSINDGLVSIDHYRNDIFINGNSEGARDKAISTLAKGGVSVKDYNIVVNNSKYHYRW